VAPYVPAIIPFTEQLVSTLGVADVRTAVAGHFTVRPGANPVRVILPAKPVAPLMETRTSPEAPELKSTGVFTEIVKPPTSTTKVVV